MATEREQTAWPRVLIIEDDEEQLFTLTIGLGREGLAISGARDSTEALAAFETIRPDVILLDVMLHGMSGIDVCRALRDRGISTPIIMLSSHNEELDVVLGIEVGADDYVAKPYRMRELAARISAQLRRSQPTPVAEVVHPRQHAAGRVPIVSAGGVTLDTERHEVTVAGREVEIPLREFQLLRELLEHAGRVVTRDELLERVWGFDYDGDPRIVATLVGRLRSRIEADPDYPTRIVTIRGVGYRFNDRP
ncbi:MAG: response regulator transcription factor [Acidimicrobiales bacterium]